MHVHIPLSQPDITQAEIDAVMDVLNTGTLTRGPKLTQFEKIIAKLSGRRHAIGVSSGTAGLHCAMLAAGVGAGDEVITTPFPVPPAALCRKPVPSISIRRR
jgi:perosamine synthetase